MTLLHEKSPLRQMIAVSDIPTAMNKLNDYTKFTFIRHPLVRFVSAYSSKFTVAKYPDYWIPVGTEIIRQFRPNATKESLAKGHDVTFQEFTAYVIAEWMKGNKLDVHWRSLHDLCQPCAIHYQVIGTIETIHEDWQMILTNVTDGPRKAFIFNDKAGDPETNRLRMHEMMKLLTHPQREILRAIYKNDFLLFGYDPYAYEP